jgi:hypothetical protein
LFQDELDLSRGYDLDGDISPIDSARTLDSRILDLLDGESDILGGERCTIMETDFWFEDKCVGETII